MLAHVGVELEALRHARATPFFMTFFFAPHVELPVAAMLTSRRRASLFGVAVYNSGSAHLLMAFVTSLPRVSTNLICIGGSPMTPLHPSLGRCAQPAALRGLEFRGPHRWSRALWGRTGPSPQSSR